MWRSAHMKAWLATVSTVTRRPIHTRPTSPRRARAMPWLAAVCVVLTSAMLAGCYYWPETFRFRITVAVMVDGELREGSSVVELRWSGKYGPKGIAGGRIAQISGVAPFVDIHPYGTLVAAFVPNTAGLPFLRLGRKRPVSLDSFVLSAYGTSSYDINSAPRGKVTIGGYPMPQFVLLPADSRAPSDARPVFPWQFADEIAPSISLEGITIEPTSHGVTTELPNPPPWLVTLARKRDSTTRFSQGFVLTRRAVMGR